MLKISSEERKSIRETKVTLERDKNGGTEIDLSRDQMPIKTY